jgi:hypothetical protein
MRRYITYNGQGGDNLDHYAYDRDIGARVGHVYWLASEVRNKLSKALSFLRLIHRRSERNNPPASTGEASAVTVTRAAPSTARARDS